MPAAISAAAPSLDAPRTDTVAAKAFLGLPERWRAALWLADAEGYDAAVVAAALGQSVGTAAELAARARAGLRERVALAHLALAEQPDCEQAARRLDRYANDDLAGREAIRVRRHLDTCESCRERLAELDDLTPLLRRSAVPVPEALAGKAEEAWAAARSAAVGPLHLTLPSGRQVPAWAERAVAGAAAAVITLGITGAVIAGGRGKSRPDDLARQTAASSTYGAADGESALGATELPLDLPSGTELPDLGRGSDGNAASRARSGSTSASSSTTTPVRSHTATTLPAIAPRTTTTTTPPPTTSTTAPTPTTTVPAPTGDAPSSPTTTVPAPLAPVLDPVTEPLAPVFGPLAPVVDVVDDALTTVVDAVDPLLGGVTGGLGGLLGG